MSDVSELIAELLSAPSRNLSPQDYFDLVRRAAAALSQQTARATAFEVEGGKQRHRAETAEAKLAQAGKALGPFAALAAGFDSAANAFGYPLRPDNYVPAVRITFGDLRRARTAKEICDERTPGT